MRHKKSFTMLLTTLALSLAIPGDAQVQWLGTGQYRLNPANPPTTFAIGPVYTLGYALDVHGELMTPPLGNVFKTDAPGHADSFWRMFHLGVEYGNLFHLDQTKDFHLNASRGFLFFHTNDLLRARINPTLNLNINGFPGVGVGGYMGVGSFAGMPSNAALSALHLDNGATIIAGYRPWMRTGVTFTESTDWMWVGAMRQSNDRIDAVINWGDNNENVPAWGPDALRFIFTRTPVGGNSASMLNGLEIARVRAAQNGNEGFWGLGDYATAGLQPGERLDLLNGRVRIRALPTDPLLDPTVTPYAVMVVDQSASPTENGVVKRLNPNLLSACGSGWSLVGSNACTAWNGNPCIPQAPHRVGVGTSAPGAKLDVMNDDLTNSNIAVQATCSVPGAASAIGVNALANSNVTNIGVVTNAAGGSVNYGAIAQGTGGGSAVGVHAIGDGAGTSSTTIGVWGDALNAGSGTAWAGFFNGWVFGSGAC